MLPASTLPNLEFDHLGLIVSDIAAARAFLQAALGITCWTPVTDDPGLRVSVQFGAAPSSAASASIVYEIIAPLGENSPIASALRQGKNILNHVAYRTSSLAQSAAHLRALGCFPTGDPHPAVVYGGHLIQFWISPLRFLIELIEKPGHRHPLAEITPAAAAPATPGASTPAGERELAHAARSAG